jgi:hypothetical protein
LGKAIQKMETANFKKILGLSWFKLMF